MKYQRVVLGSLFCLACFLVSSPLFGQATGSLSGTVSDPSGAVVPGASVTATSQGTDLARDTKTDADGHYLIPLLPIGTYSLKVSAQGFQVVEQKDLVLQVDQSREVDFSLPTAKVQQTVEVSATAVTVNTSNATLGQVITSQQVAQLPLNGRDFVQLATLAPGTVQETNPNSFFNGGGSSEVSIRGSFSLSVGGSRANSTDWLLDGVDNNELTAGGIAILPSIDALQEFKVLTYNYSAEYGTRGGPTVLLTTKSGTNQFHGSLFEYLRNTSLNARNFFAPNRGKFNQNQFGGSIGGPIKKDKTFFFADYQGRRTVQGITFVGQVPTPQMLMGDFTQTFTDVPSFQLTNPYTNFGFPGGSPFLCDSGGNPLIANSSGVQVPTPGSSACNKLPPGLLGSGGVENPIGLALANLYPAANNVGSLLSQDFLNTPNKQLKEGEADLRLDHNFSSRDSIFARFSYDQATVFQPGGSSGFAELSAFASTQSLADHGRNAALSETHIFSPNSINKVTFGYNRIFNHILSFGSGSCEAEKLGIPNANLDCNSQGQCPPNSVSCGLSSFLGFGGFWSLGDRGFAPFQGGTNVFYGADSFDVIRGNHDITFGGQVRANQMNVLTNAFQDGFGGFTGAFTNNALADMLLGILTFGEHDQTFDGAVTGRRWKLYRPFVQDNWRAKPNLTLNLGLAWAFVTPITEAHNRQSNFNFQTGQFIVAGQNGSSSGGTSLDTTAVEPRIGLAWSPHGDHKTSIRAGYSIFHDSSWNQGAQGLWENPPYFGASFPAFGQSISAGFGINCSPICQPLTRPTSASQFGGTLQSIENLNFKLGTIQQFNLNVERQIPGDVLLTVGYAGARSTHLLEDGQNLNLASPTGCGKIPGYTFGCGQSSEPWIVNPLSSTTAAQCASNSTLPGCFGFIYDAFDNGFARYDSLQVKAETKSARHGLYALVGYTYSKATDTGLSDGLGSNIGALYFPLPNIGNADKGLSQINLTHNFTASVVYDLPFGKGKTFGNDWNGAENALLGNWEVNVIQRAISGFPLFIIDSNGGTAGVNFQNNGVNAIRPNETCNPQVSNPTVAEFFNPSCFAAPPAGELGFANRTPLSGPRFVNTDFSAVKNFPLPFREGSSLQFRAEVFNLWNHPQFYVPGVDVASAGFGVINSTVNNPRLIQFALKLTF
ncbi:MAG TPA: carboxypeptidase regulatory-like domain-containing protein [Terriglobia bacterium]|nr:carboxypeptidase regulatory-like domain-containing protein [Terriglobia bacterium]